MVACEFSGTVRDAFRRKGHDAISCDLLPSEAPGPHVQGNVLALLQLKWDLVIAHPPCTLLCAAGARWWKDKELEQREAVRFFMRFAEIDTPYAIENPVGRMSGAWRKPDQIIHPWQFGHGETKATCLWLNKLPLLKPTNIVEGREARIHKMSQTKDRSKKRSITYAGIAEAMAEQWGKP